MKNKKVFIIIICILIIIFAIGFGIFKAKYNADYLYNLDGTVVDGKKELFEHLKSINNLDERKKQIDALLEQNFISQEEANQLYK